MKTIFIATAAAVTLTAATHAATLASPDIDSDSYLFIGTNNQFDPQISLGESNPAGHFNWGYIHFDTTTLVTSGEKHLTLSAIEYATLSGGETGPPTTTILSSGSATVQLVALGATYDDYLASGDKKTWYDENVQNAGVSILGTFNFIDESTLSIDVTDTVNKWINGSSDNDGFAIFSTSGNVELGSVTYTDPALRPSLSDTAITAVPEPSAAILSALGLFAFTIYRRR